MDLLPVSLWPLQGSCPLKLEEKAQPRAPIPAATFAGMIRGQGLGSDQRVTIALPSLSV